jgi:hypothetical protein
MSLISRRLPCRSLTATLSSVLLTKQPSMVTCEELSGSKPSVFISQGKSGSSCFVFEMSFTPERDARPSCPSRGGHVRSAGFDRLSVGLDAENIRAGFVIRHAGVGHDGIEAAIGGLCHGEQRTQRYR